MLALAAKTALDTRLGEFATMEAKEADLAERELDCAARVGTVATGEAELRRRAAILDKCCDDVNAILKED